MTGKSNKREQSIFAQNSTKTNLWGFLQTILLALIQRGLGIPVLLFLIIIAGLVANHLGGNCVIDLNDLINDLKSLGILGWILSIGTVISWTIHIKYLKRIHNNEMERVCSERNELQKEHGKPGTTDSSGHN